MQSLNNREKKAIALSARVLTTYIQGVSHEDLFHDVVLSLLKQDSPRHWPRNLRAETFFRNAMRSLADNNRKKTLNNHNIITEAETAELNELTMLENRGRPDNKDNQLDAEKKITKLQEHFSHDPEVQIIMAGKMEGHTEIEIKSKFNLTQNTYDSARKRLSRGLLKMKMEV